MIFLDTNVILRWLLADDPLQSKVVERLVNRAQARELIVTDVILAEIFYVMRGKGYTRQQIGQAIDLLLELPMFSIERHDASKLLPGLLVSHPSLDFADCYLLARALQTQQTLQTFDKALQKAYASHS